MPARDYLAALRRQSNEHRRRERLAEASSRRLSALMVEARDAGHSLREIGDVCRMSNVAVLKRTAEGD